MSTFQTRADGIRRAKHPFSRPRKKNLDKREAHKSQSHRCLEVPAIATLWSRASTVCHRRCFFGTSKPSLARLRFRLLSINQITTSQTESLTLLISSFHLPCIENCTSCFFPTSSLFSRNSRSRQQPLRLNSATTNSESRATYTKSALYLTHP